MDLDAQLWKTCFYSGIELYRKEIKNIVSVISQEGSSVDNNRKYEVKLARLVSSFNDFLKRISVFYNGLLLTVRIALRLSNSIIFFV